MSTETVQTSTAAQYRIYAANWPRLAKQLARLVRKSEKLDVGHVRYEVIHTEQVVEKRGGKDKSFTVLTINLEGEAPRIAGWEFYAVLQHAGEAGTIVRTTPAAPEGIAKDYRDAEPRCEHCNVNRQRKDTFLVFNPTTQELKQVGSTCIRDFLGHGDPHALAAYIEALASMQALLRCGGGDMDGGGEDVLALKTFLDYSAAHIRVNGWCSRTRARDGGGRATADVVFDQLTGIPDNKARPQYTEPTEADTIKADAALEWAQGIDPRTDNDYLSNIRVVANVPYMPFRSAGLAASIVSSHGREETRREERARRESDPRGPGAYVGERGKRAEFTVQMVADPQHIESAWGVSRLYRFEDADGNALVTFSSVDLGIEKNTWVRIRATVKQHTQYSNRAQTQLTRVTVLAHIATDETLGKGFDALCEEEGIEVRK